MLARISLSIAVSVAWIGCVPPPDVAAPPSVRPEDVAAWSGVPLIELETHAIFSILPKETRPLSDGTEMWVYASCPILTVHGESLYARMRCSGAEKGPECCHNQFIVKSGTIVSYRPTGPCFTGCASRPKSNPCR